MSGRSVRRMARDIEDRYYRIKQGLKTLIDERMTGREREGNGSKWHFLCHQAGDEPTLYQVNASTYIYDMTSAELSELLKAVQGVLDRHLLEGGEANLWAMNYVSAEIQRGKHEAFNNLSHQSVLYAQQTSLAQLLSSPAYQNQIAATLVSTYSDWKGISDTARTDLANVITDAVARGVNPRETAKVISKRLDISASRAKNIAQTEQVGALREAQWTETDWAKERLGLRTGLLHISALKPTTRTSHAFWHGKVRTTEAVREWYSINGNRYRCYCSQIPCLLDENGQIANKGVIERLIQERDKWKRAA